MFNVIMFVLSLFVTCEDSQYEKVLMQELQDWNNGKEVVK